MLEQPAAAETTADKAWEISEELIWLHFWEFSSYQATQTLLTDCKGGQYSINFSTIFQENVG